MPTFILNDESIKNSYGFRVRNAGIDFTRFDQNPVMLDSHTNTTAGVLGNWKNRVITGPLLKMDSNFDLEKPSAKEVSGQVDRGFVKGASMGLAVSFDENSWERQPDGSLDLIKSEMMESSICGVPSNSGSLCMYNKATGELIAESDFKLSLSNICGNSTNLSLQNEIRQHPSPSPGGGNKYSAILTADDFVNLSDSEKMDFKTNHNAAYMQLWGKTSVSATDVLQTQIDFSRNQLNKNLSGQPVNYIQDGVKTIDDFERLSDAEKLHFKNSNLQAYKALFARTLN